MIVKKNCIYCKKEASIEVDETAYLAWQNKEGHLINLMPKLTIEEREMLISGTCGECFDEMCNDDEPDPSEPYRQFEQGICQRATWGLNL